MRRRFPLFTLAAHITWIIIFTCALLTATLLAVIHMESGSAAYDSAATLFREVTETTTARIDVVVTSIATLTETSAAAFTEEPGLEEAGGALESVRFMKALLDANTDLMSVYAGYDDGAFHQVISLRGDKRILETYKAPPNCAYIDRVIRLEGGGRVQRWRFLDKDLKFIADRVEPQVAYDPRGRPWYVAAKKAERAAFTAPYIFSSSRLPGITCARVLAHGGGVFGADISLARFMDMLTERKAGEHGVLWLVTDANRLVAYPGFTPESVVGDGAPQFPQASNAPYPLAQAAGRAMAASPATPGRLFPLDVNGELWLAGLTPMPNGQGLGLVVAVAAPMRDFTAPFTRMSLRILLFAALILAVVLPLGMLLARRASRPVTKLVALAEKIRALDFSPSPPVASSVAEVHALANACQVMKSTIQARTEHLISARSRLEKLVEGGLALSAEKNLSTLATLIFQTAKELASADGGVMYLMENGQLEVEMLSLRAESVVLGGLSGNPAPRVMVRPEIMAFLSPDSVLRPACEAFNNREIVIVRDQDLTLFPTGLPEEPSDYTIRSLVAVPIITRRDEVLGVIQLFNPLGGEAISEAGEHDLRGFIGSLAAQAAVTLDNRNLVNSLRDIFDALIRVVASSIDAKSPYTAGHCARVPELARMLARAVHEAGDGPLREFKLETEDDWRQLWIASWMHDCGKMTTPEYVVDKATKLETIYNRIHEVRTRFEVLHRDAWIEYYQDLARGDADQTSLKAALDAKLARLQSDFAFVAACNRGGEFLSEQDKERLTEIAGRVWARHFSDRLGISDDEARRKGEAAEPELPAQEYLLADRPEHVIPRSRDYSSLKDVRGEPLDIPLAEYNRGELYNLCIPRGTLTPEERFKINEHTLSCMDMLGKIPFPEGLSRVTEIAASHHENLVGTGYPLKKSKSHLSVEARILAVADVFEALTASDRPYKPAKPLSEALKIMSFMRNDGHIDPDIFDVFLKEGIFIRYAEEYLMDSQRDVVDVSAYLGKKVEA